MNGSCQWLLYWSHYSTKICLEDLPALNDTSLMLVTPTGLKDCLTKLIGSVGASDKLQRPQNFIRRKAQSQWFESKCMQCNL